MTQVMKNAKTRYVRAWSLAYFWCMWSDPITAVVNLPYTSGMK